MLCISKLFATLTTDTRAACAALVAYLTVHRYCVQPSRVLPILVQPVVLLTLTLCFSGTVSAHGTDKHNDDAEPVAAPIILAPGYETLAFPPPPVGSYSLSHVGEAASGAIIDSTGEQLQLGELMAGRITVLSFIYRACDDVNGCPLATYVMHQVRSSLEAHGDLSDRVRLVSMSFDPVNDTAAAMDAYKKSFQSSSIDWRFVTAPSIEALEPVLEAYDQPISRTALEDDTISVNHMLRVFLIDANGSIRNIYSAGLLHAETLFHDVLTLEQERKAGSVTDAVADASGLTQKSASSSASHQLVSNTAVGVRDGLTNERVIIDYRAGYSDGSYASSSTALKQNAQSVDLLALANDNLLGLPERPNFDELTKEKIALGRQLFYERRLSINDTFSCAMCHIPQQAFTSNELNTSVGVEGRTVKRNAPTILNVGYAKRLFHDARESRLDQQVWAPLLAHNEMANPSIGYVLEKVSALPEYAQQFDAVYGAPATMQTLGDALAAYQQVLVSGNSAFDRWFFGREENAISESAKWGYKLFSEKAGCIACHTIGDRSAMFSDFGLHNTGIGYAQSMSKPVAHEVTLAPGVVVTVDPASYAAASEKPPNDLGLYEVTQKPSDRWKFKTPSLRNVALTAPYMHNGSISTLEEVVDFYVSGGIENPELSPLMQPLPLGMEERAALVEFMRSLTGDSAVALMNDGMAAPIGDAQSLQ